MSLKKSTDGGALFVEVRVISAKNLVAADSNGFSDPYAMVGVGKSKKQKTRVIKKDLSPEWNQKFTFKINDPKESVIVEVYDKDLIGSDFLGDVQIPLTNLVKSQEKVAWYKLCKTTKGDIQIGITPVNFGIDKIRESPAPPNPRDNVNSTSGPRPGEATQIQGPNGSYSAPQNNYGQSAPAGYHPGAYGQQPPPPNANFGSANAPYGYQQYQPQPNVQPLGGYSSFTPPTNTLHPNSIPMAMNQQQQTIHLQQQQMQAMMSQQQTMHLQQQQQQAMMRQGTPAVMPGYPGAPAGYPQNTPPGYPQQQYQGYPPQQSPQQHMHQQQQPPQHVQSNASQSPSLDPKKTNKSMVEESASREGYEIGRASCRERV